MMQKRPIRVEGDIAYVPLTKGYEAVIDATDVPLVVGFNWTVWKCGGKVYAYRKVKNVSVYLHRVLLQPRKGFQVDHKDGDGLNCRRVNLREATRAQNLRNRTVSSLNKHGAKGVNFDARRNKWRARIVAEGKEIWLGYYLTKEAAHQAYCEASPLHHGEFGRTG